MARTLSNQRSWTVIQGGKPNWTGVVRLIQDRLAIPLRKKRPTVFFVNSLSDLFHEALKDEEIDQIFATMALCPQHTFQILTKEPERMRDYFAAPKLIGRLAGALFDHIGPSISTHNDVERWCKANGVSRKERDRKRDIITDGGGFHFFRHSWPLANVWLGTSIENKEEKRRIDFLRKTPAALRFLSLEPLLEDLGELDLTGISWVISGGESGPGARPAPPEWFRSIRDQCIAADVRYFHKQNGAWSPVGKAASDKYRDVPVGDGTHHRLFNIGRKDAGAMLDGREWREIPEAHHA